MMHRVQVSVGVGTVWLEIEAESVEAAALQASRTGGRVLRVEAARTGAGPARIRYSQSVFLQETVTLLKAGLHIVEVLDTLYRKEGNAGFREVLGRLLARLREGASFSQALAKEAGLFPPVLIAGIAASETTGGLAATLERYLEYDARLGQIKRKVSASAIYPLLLLAVGSGVILFLLAYVVPKFSSILDGSGRGVGWGTKVLLACGQMVNGYPWVVLLLVSAFTAAIAWLVVHPQGRIVALGAANRIPVLSDILRTLGLSRFYRTLALLLEGGIPLLPALEMVRGILPHPQAAEVDMATAKLKSGQMLSEALAGTSMVPPIAESLLRVGERSGALAGMSNKLADFLDVDLDRKVDMFARLFEPLLMTVMGVVIGTIVVLMYAPIFDMVGSVGA